MYDEGDHGSFEPFSPDGVKALLESQSRGDVHPYTCPNRSDGKHREILSDLGALVPTVRGWICPFCSYTQNWALVPATSRVAPGIADFPHGMNAAAYVAFREWHICHCAGLWRRQPPREVFWEESDDNGIGVAFTAKCRCGASMNVTDYSCW